MLRCFSLAALAALLLAAPASAQLSFDRDDYYRYEASGVTVVQDVFSTNVNENVPPADRSRIQALIALRGENKTWDFTPIAYPNESVARTTLYYDGDQTSLPGASNFPNADIAFKNDSTDANGATYGEAYTYGRLPGQRYITDGIFVPAASSQTGQDDILLYEPDGLEQLSFPLTYGTVTTDQTVSTIDAGPAGMITVTTDYRSEVVGYGTLVTPAGSFQTLMIEFKVTITTGGFSQDYFTYSWVTDGRYTAAALYQEAPQGGVVVNASYTTPGGGTQNQPPSVPATQTATAPSGQTTAIDVLAGVTDPDGDPLTITDVSDPANGTAEVGDDGTGRRRAPVVLYTPDAGFSGTDSFTFTVSDGTDTATGTVNVTVTNNTAADDDPTVLTFAAAPNPSSGEMRLLVTTAQPAAARLAVYDLLGREAAVVWTGALTPGSHAFPVDTAALAPGVYVARLVLDGTVSTLRLTIAR